MKKKSLAAITSLLMTIAIIFSGGGRIDVQATEAEEKGLLFDGAKSISVSDEVDKNAVDEKISLNIDPTISSYAMGDNTDVNNAETITVNSLQYGMIAKENQQRWYLFYTDAGKLTVDLTTPYSTGVDYDVYIYQYDDLEGAITLINGSENEDTADEHFAMMVDAGVYFVVVNGYSGYDTTNSFQLGIGYSTTYDSAEIDDTRMTANVISVPFNVTGTIDNAYDHDYVKFTLSEEVKITFGLANNGSTNNTYRMDLYNGAGLNIGYVPQGYQGTATLTPGNYYARLCATAYGGDNAATYTLTGSVEKALESAAGVTVTKAGDAFINYGQGTYWRIDNSATVQGTAYDAGGYPIANANIEIRVDVVPGSKTITESGVTDSQGNFSINLVLGPGAGQNMYDSGVSYHYYDVVPIRFYSNGTKITSNISYIYHFAYQVGHPF